MNALFLRKPDQNLINKSTKCEEKSNGWYLEFDHVFDFIGNTNLLELEILVDKPLCIKACSRLSKFVSYTLTEVGNNFLCNCTSLICIDIPNLIRVGNYFLSCCLTLESAKFNLLTETGTNFMENCCCLKNIEINSLTIVDSYFLSCCYSLEKINLENIEEIKDSFLVFCSTIKYVKVSGPITRIGAHLLLNATPNQVIITSSCPFNIGKRNKNRNNKLFKIYADGVFDLSTMDKHTDLTIICTQGKFTKNANVT